ncbi:LexA family protein [Psychroflexus aestuariivivens]|uniref:LexA family protein n=1 Tax=Psychroflexus aestuariivivens TaxID=1795040 RepID=UPI000FD786BA|nr:translesion error-prone DNA polymerase V autoproteolytic subunit [Psychroflexus aestuariivivens]
MQDLIRKNSQCLKIYHADFSSDLELPVVSQGISAGFPSPAEDFLELRMDLNREFIKHPNATFYAYVSGDSMIGAGLDSGDLLIIDKSIEIKNNRIAVCFIDGEFTIKRIKVEGNSLWLFPANKKYSPIQITEDNEFVIWGVVTTVIKNLL